MTTRLRSRIRWVGCVMAAFIVLVPIEALADGPLPEATNEPASVTAVNTPVVEPPTELVDSLEETADGIIDETTAVVVDDVLPAVGEAAGAAAGVSDQVQGAAGTVTGVSDQVQGAAGAVNDAVTHAGSAANGIGRVQSAGATATAASPIGSNEPSHRDERAQSNQSETGNITIGSTRPAWRRMRFEPVAVVGFPPLRRSDLADQPSGDPCEGNPELACLGLLYGIGEFVDATSHVLGLFLAGTGMALGGLLMLAFALLLGGVIALSIAPRRVTTGELA